jgi:hypothetical protein
MKREKDFARAGRENEESVWGANVVGEAGQLVATVTSSTIQTKNSVQSVYNVSVSKYSTM